MLISNLHCITRALLKKCSRFGSVRSSRSVRVVILPRFFPKTADRPSKPANIQVTCSLYWPLGLVYPLYSSASPYSHTHTPSPPPPCGSLLLYGNTAHPAALWVFLLNKPNRPICLSVCLSTRRPPPSIHTYCCRHVWQHTHTRTHTYARMHTYAHARTHTRTHTYAHTLNICSWITLETKDIIDFHSVL